MGFAPNSIGKYKLGRTIGEGTFAKVKLAVDSTNGQYVAAKIIDKKMVTESDLKCQADIYIFFSVKNSLLSSFLYIVWD